MLASSGVPGTAAAQWHLCSKLHYLCRCTSDILESRMYDLRVLSRSCVSMDPDPSHGSRWHTHTHTHIYIHIHIHTYVHTYIHTYIHTYHTYIHHTYTHAYIHVYIYICIERETRERYTRISNVEANLVGLKLSLCAGPRPSFRLLLGYELRIQSCSAPQRGPFFYPGA